MNKQKLTMKEIQESQPESSHKTIKAKIGLYPSESKVELPDGTPLGLVQNVTISAGVGKHSTMSIETLCDESEVEVLQRDTELNVKIKEPICSKDAGSLKEELYEEIRDKLHIVESSLNDFALGQAIEKCFSKYFPKN